MSSQQYTDEKRPEVIYEVIPVVETVQPKPRRPLWRRLVRTLIVFFGMMMLWSTFTPLVRITHRHCGGMRHHKHPHHAPDFPLFESPEDAVKDVVPHFNRPLQHFTFPSDLEHFFLTQESFNVPSRTEVVGKVIVKSCSKAENISAHFHFDATDDSLLSKIEIEASKDGLTFKADPFSLAKQTVNAIVLLVIPKSDDYELKGLRVSTTQLNVWLTKSFSSYVNATYISTVSGNVGSRGTGDDLLNVNNLQIKTTSGTIVGHYPLEHALALETTSGEIKVHVESENRKEEPAYFKTETVSGSAKVAFDGDLNPRPLMSKHTSVSGSIQLYYPEDWQGGFKLETTSGDLDVVGKGTKIDKKEKDITGKVWQVAKGNGDSQGYASTVSGAIHVRIGDLEED